MMIALATSIASLACHGCVSSDTYYDGVSTPAAERSLGMTLAVPGPMGNGALNQPSGDVTASMAGAAPGTLVTHLTAPEAPISVSAITGPQPANAAFSLTGAGAPGTPLSQTNFAWNGSPALARVAAELATRRYGQPQEVTRDMALGVSIGAPSEQTGLGFDVSLAPRLSIRDEGDLRTQRFGGEVRLGQSLEKIGRGGQPEGWYLFVGADGEALVWDNDGMPNFGDVFDVQLTDQVTVGDLQAGISVQRGGGELSFSYIRREMKFSDRNQSLKDTEDFAGITFTMRR